jgi:electron-transferring-flavoprotein dehydrogenase
MDVLFIGAGPASLAGAIKLKQLLNQRGRGETVVVIEKADKIGQHNLSGAVFEVDVLNELIQDWSTREDAFIIKMLANRVGRDEMYLLLGDRLAFKVPEVIRPNYMRHNDDHIISVSELVTWLADVARELGVEIYTGFAAKEILIEGNSVKGVKLGDHGLDKEGNKQSNYVQGEILEAKITVFGEGSLGKLTEELVNKFNLGDGRNPQIYSIGVKEVVRLPAENNFGPNRVIHTIGFPNRILPPDIFGGGTLYSMEDNLVAVAVVLSLDWRYCDLNPQRELQFFKSHKLIDRLLEGGEVIAYGAKTLPEGGYYSLPEPVTNGAVIIGDAAGLTNVRKLKGLHYAIKSGIAAAEAIFKAIEMQDTSKNTLKTYEDILNKSFVMKDIRKARNYRQVFAKTGIAGLYLGAPLSLIQQWIPIRLWTKPDHEGMKKIMLDRQYGGGTDRLSAVNLSGTTHREDQPPHITFTDPGKCTSCGDDYGCHPCEFFCPAEVYRFEADNLILNPSNCVHCQSCRVKCPHQVIRWEIPEGGDGPRYKMM